MPAGPAVRRLRGPSSNTAPSSVLTLCIHPPTLPLPSTNTTCSSSAPCILSTFVYTLDKVILLYLCGYWLVVNIVLAHIEVLGTLT